MPDVDAVIVGAGFAGLYMLHGLRQLGLSALVATAAHSIYESPIRRSLPDWPPWNIRVFPAPRK